MAEAVAALRPRGLPHPPAAALRGVPWRTVGFVAVGFAEVDDGAPRVAAVPIARARVVLGDAVVGHVAEDPCRRRLVALLERRFVVAWSADEVGVALGRLLGGGVAFWHPRTVDCRRLVRRFAEAPPGAEQSLAAALAAFRLPEPRACDALDVALSSAQLFLILATKLEGRGGTVAELLA